MKAAVVEDWISIKEKRPELKKRVLVFVDKDFFPKQIGIHLGNGKFRIEKWESERNDVTHWMPLPENPKGTILEYFTDKLNL